MGIPEKYEGAAASAVTRAPAEAPEAASRPGGSGDKMASPTAAAGKAFGLDAFRRMLMGLGDTPEKEKETAAATETDDDTAATEVTSEQNRGDDVCIVEAPEEPSTPLRDGVVPEASEMPALRTPDPTGRVSELGVDGDGEGVDAAKTVRPPGRGLSFEDLSDDVPARTGHVAESSAPTSPRPFLGGTPPVFDEEDGLTAGQRSTPDVANAATPREPPTDADVAVAESSGICETRTESHANTGRAGVLRPTTSPRPVIDHAAAQQKCEDIHEMIRHAIANRASGKEIDEMLKSGRYGAITQASTPGPGIKENGVDDDDDDGVGTFGGPVAKLYDTPVVSKSAVKREREGTKVFTGPFHKTNGTPKAKLSTASTSADDGPGNRVAAAVEEAVRSPSAKLSMAVEETVAPPLKAFPIQPVVPAAPPSKPALSSTVALSRLSRDMPDTPEFDASQSPEVTSIPLPVASSTITMTDSSPSAEAVASVAEVGTTPPVAAIEPHPPEIRAPATSKTFGRVVIPTPEPSTSALTAAKAPASASASAPAHLIESARPQQSSKPALAGLTAKANFEAAPSALSAVPKALSAVSQASRTAAQAGAAAARAAVKKATEPASATSSSSSPVRKSFRSLAKGIATKIGFITASQSSVRAGVDMPLTNFGNGGAGLCPGTASLSSRVARVSWSSSSSARSSTSAAASTSSSVHPSGTVASGASTRPPKTASIIGNLQCTDRAVTSRTKTANTADENVPPSEANSHGSGSRRHARHSTGSLHASRVVQEFMARAAAVNAAADAWGNRAETQSGKGCADNKGRVPKRSSSLSSKVGLTVAEKGGVGGVVLPALASKGTNGAAMGSITKSSNRRFRP